MHVSFLVDSLGPGKVITNSLYPELQLPTKPFLFSFLKVSGEKKKERRDLQFPANEQFNVNYNC